MVSGYSPVHGVDKLRAKYRTVKIHPYTSRQQKRCENEAGSLDKPFTRYTLHGTMHLFG